MNQQMFLWVLFFILGGLFLLSFGTLFMLSKIVRIDAGRPFGIKFACFYLNIIGISLAITGLMMASLVANRVFCDYRGISLLIVYFLALVVPAIFLILTFGLFCLRKWARISALILLFLGFIEGIVSLALRKNFLTDFIDNFHSEALLRFSRDSAERIPAVAAFNPSITFIWLSFYLIFILYFFRREIKEAFSGVGKERISINKRGLILFLVFTVISLFIGDKLYQECWIKIKDNPHLFTDPIKAKEVITAEPLLLKDFVRHNVLGYQVYLPAKMEKLSVPTKIYELTKMTLFTDKNKGIKLSISKAEERDYRIFIAPLYARWNPFLLFLKGMGCKRSKEVKFVDKEGILCRDAYSSAGIEKYRLMLKSGNNDYLECMFETRAGDNSLDETTILNIVAAIKQIPE